MRRVQRFIGCTRNGLPVGTLLCIVVALNLARHADGIYVDERLSDMAHSLSDRPWGGSWWYPVAFRMPSPSKPMVPEGAWLS